MLLVQSMLGEFSFSLGVSSFPDTIPDGKTGVCGRITLLSPSEAAFLWSQKTCLYAMIKSTIPVRFLLRLI